MYRHILIPTDGSRLSQNAIAHGVALAKSINAKVTILTVSTPFHTFVVDPEMVTDTPEQYAKHMANLAAKYLNSAKEAAARQPPQRTLGPLPRNDHRDTIHALPAMTGNVRSDQKAKYPLPLGHVRNNLSYPLKICSAISG
jgi:nucleotide-binding universal stress UspA family protein